MNAARGLLGIHVPGTTPWHRMGVGWKYLVFLALVLPAVIWPEPRLSAAILLVTHLAYHLGALRQVVALVRTNDGP